MGCFRDNTHDSDIKTLDKYIRSAEPRFVTIGSTTPKKISLADERNHLFYHTLIPRPIQVFLYI